MNEMVVVFTVLVPDSPKINKFLRISKYIALKKFKYELFLQNHLNVQMASKDEFINWIWYMEEEICKSLKCLTFVLLNFKWFCNAFLKIRIRIRD